MKAERTKRVAPQTVKLHLSAFSMYFIYLFIFFDVYMIFFVILQIASYIYIEKKGHINSIIIYK